MRAQAAEAEVIALKKRAEAAEQRARNALAKQREITDLLDKAEAEAARWKDDARIYAQNGEHWFKRAEAAQAELARVRLLVAQLHVHRNEDGGNFSCPDPARCVLAIAGRQL